MNNLPPLPGVGVASTASMQGWLDLVEAAGEHLPDKVAPAERSLLSSMRALGQALVGVAQSQSDAANLHQSQLRADVILQKGRDLEGAALDAADKALAAYRSQLDDTRTALEKYAMPAGVKPGQGGDAVQALVIEQVLDTLKDAGHNPSALMGAVERIARDAIAAGDGGKGTIAALTSEPARLFYNRAGFRLDWVYTSIAKATSAASDGADIYMRSCLDLLGLVSGKLVGLGDAIAISLYGARQAFTKRYASVPAPADPNAGVVQGSLTSQPAPQLTQRDAFFGRPSHKGSTFG